MVELKGSIQSVTSRFLCGFNRSMVELKVIALDLLEVGHQCFNRSMVELKADTLWIHVADADALQSVYGRIESRHVDGHNWLRDSSFNRSMVELKARHGERPDESATASIGLW